MNINWIKVNFRDEYAEFERIAMDFSGKKSDSEYKKIVQSNLKYLEDTYKKSNLIELNNSLWQKMDNTDSWETTDIKLIQKAMKVNNEQRSIENVLIEYFSGKVRAPIALLQNDGTPSLIGGNTRLMVARMLKIRPKIVLIKTDR